jgi:hypothetical protein
MVTSTDAHSRLSSMLVSSEPPLETESSVP